MKWLGTFFKRLFRRRTSKQSFNTDRLRSPNVVGAQATVRKLTGKTVWMGHGNKGGQLSIVQVLDLIEALPEAEKEEGLRAVAIIQREMWRS